MTRRTDFDKDAISASEALIYTSFLDRMASGLTPTLASGILRTAKACGVSRARVLEVIRKLNPDFITTKETE